MRSPTSPSDLEPPRAAASPAAATPPTSVPGSRAPSAGRGSAGGGRLPPLLRGILARPAGRVALVGVVLLAACALLAPWLAPYDPAAQLDIVALKDQPPSAAHPFGTDPYSRDVLSRVLHGARVSLAVAVLATAVSVTVGTAYGAVAGWRGGRTDAVLMRLVDAALAVPRVLLLLAIVALWGGLPLWAFVLLLGLTQWFAVSRLVRAEVLARRGAEYVTAARALGAGEWRILARHVLPNVLSPVLVAATLGVANVVVLEAGLSYLGFGVRPPTPSWGNVIQDGADQVAALWWVSLFPGLAVVLTVACFNALGDVLRDVVDARHVDPR